MKKNLTTALRVLACAMPVALAGCYVVPATPYPYTTTIPANYDASFAAVSGAMRDQGLAITVEDPGRGVVSGVRDGVTVTGTLTRQADGSVRVQFDSQNSGRDPTLIDRVTGSYNRRMGR
ncbi:MAG TPA: hypothetical protein VFL64_02575 [Rhizobacter sp.]|nr:hypothetical protein [Rhizobacter sp.]